MKKTSEKPAANAASVPGLLALDSYLQPFADDIRLRMRNYEDKRRQLVGETGSLSDFANGDLYYGFHRTEDGWVYREWAPGASAMFLTGDFNNWDTYSHRLEKKENGNWEIVIPGRDALKSGQKVQAVVVHDGQELRRIPAYAHYVVQDPVTIEWNAQIFEPEKPFVWTDAGFAPQKPLLIYECHVGMAQEEGRIGTYREFADNILPRIKDLGYDTIQVMAIMEHPYYASFGYQVTNFFAASSRYGTPEDLKYMVNRAHEMGIAVLLDVVHSHAAKNTREGLNEFDGTDYQYFHAGPEGDHPAWNTKLFDYGKPEVLHFLLSNLKFWMTEYHFDGFRFDGVTSMLYHDHGLGTAFTSYDKYFSMNTDTQAVTYLTLAAELIHEINPQAIVIGEDMSAMPGLCRPVEEGGMGFDYRLAMGEPDMWIKMLKEQKDEDWDLWKIWYELTIRRPGEPVIGYAESHDQALVGDKTIMFRLCDADMYWHMDRASQSLVIDRGMALHKLIRLLTSTLGGEGYLNFMGNEFGHPEWIDFPREGNGWSYQYCRRQWSLADNGLLRYSYLNDFDRAMVKMLKDEQVLGGKTHNLYTHQDDKVLAYSRGKAVVVFNLHPSKSFQGYFIPVGVEGRYRVILSSDDDRFGGQNRIQDDYIYDAKRIPDGRIGFPVYLPSRTAIVFERIEEQPVKEEEKPKKRVTRKKTAEAAPEAEAVKEEAPKKRTTRKKAAEAAPEAEAVKEEAPKKRTTRKKATEPAAEAEAVKEEAPKKRTTRKKAAASDTSEK